MKFKIAKASPHYWEEPIISGKKGSGAIFFSGCSMKCIYCQNYQISHNAKGLFIDEKQLAKLMLYLQDKGVHNINLVTPSHYAAHIAKVLEQIKNKSLTIPVVYNTSAYDKLEDLKKLDGLVDIYLPDIKYSNNELAQKYSKAPDYTDIAINALKEMRRQQPKDIIKKGIMLKGVIVRHLTLPSHIENTKQVLHILEEIDNTLYVSLMAQYFPTPNTIHYPEINRRLTDEEYQNALNYFLNSSLENGFKQHPSSATEEYVPDFDLAQLQELLQQIT